MIISFSYSHKTLVLRFKGNQALSYLFAHTTIFLSTHFDAPGAHSAPKDLSEGGDIDDVVFCCLRPRGIRESEPMHNLAVSQTQVFDVLNLGNYPTG
jgi:hypothetical protein|tara:strand:+ start:529 stop:819 length:291 start_codon:yes stop_codon:yes gene_type:complete